MKSSRIYRKLVLQSRFPIIIKIELFQIYRILLKLERYILPKRIDFLHVLNLEMIKAGYRLFKIQRNVPIHIH